MTGEFSTAIELGKNGLQDMADMARDAADTVVDTPGRIMAAFSEMGEFSAKNRGLGSGGDGDGDGGGKDDPIVSIVAPKVEKEKIDEVAKALDELSAGAFDLLFPIEQGLRSIEAAYLGMARRMGAQFGAILSGNVSGALRAGVEAAGRGIGSLIGGAGGGAVGGLVGAGIGGAMQGLGALGSEGAGAMVSKITKSIDAIASGIENLPDFIVRLAERLPDLLMTLVSAILVNLPKILTALLIKLPVHFAAGLVEWWRGVWDSIRAWFRDLFSIGNSGDGRTTRAETAQAEAQRATMESLQSAGQLGNGAAAIGSRDIGGLIPQTGLYMMHAGETVVRGPNQGPNTGTSGATGRASGLGMMGATVNVNVSTPVADSNFAEYLGRELDRLFGPNGLRSANVFGG
eukprot:GHVO01039727.1.p1 GENE.GHVO01039727.1~~GHVO01039727.1.p1  ORF type:complete len:402 (-),score=38.68 GHVO01039727.1:538-1743(-)